MWNKQRYCGQLQSHVEIQNFRGVIRQITIPSKSSYFFMVLWHGWSCKEVCGTILWVGKQDELSNSTKYLLPVSMTTTLKRKNWNLLRNVTSMLSNCSEHVETWHVLEDPIFYGPWTNLHDPSQNGPKFVTNDYLVWSLTSITHVIRNNHCHVGSTAKQCRLGLFHDSDFAGYLEDSKSTSGWTLRFGSHTFVPISWMCKKTNFSLTQFNRIRNHLHGRRIEVRGIWSSQFFTETRIRVIKNGATR